MFIIEDLKNFKNLDIKKKIIYGVSILLIIIILFNLGGTKKVKVVKSKNYYGMRFNISISDFCKIYNKNFKQYSEQQNAEPDKNSQLYLKAKNFEKQDIRHKQSGLDIYICTVDLQGIKTSFVLYTEPNNKKIVGVSLMADEYAYSNNDAYKIIIDKIFVASIVKTLDSTIKYPDQMYKSCTLANKLIYYKNNRLYNINENTISNTRDFVVMALSEKKYDELYPILVDQYDHKEYTSNDDENKSTYVDEEHGKPIRILVSSEEDIEDTYTSDTTEESNTTKDNNNSESDENTNSLGYTNFPYYLYSSDNQVDTEMYVQIGNGKLNLYDNYSNLYYSGDFKFENGYITGTYTTVRCNTSGVMETLDINDDFKFEVISDKEIKDILGYNYWCGQIFGKGFTYRAN